jgi:large subunit ribosomal protein L4
VGGGKVHTPRPRDYSQDMPRKMRKAALRSALTVKASENSIVILDEISLPEAKTSLMAEAVKTLVGDSSVLILMPEKSDVYNVVIRSTNNLPSTKVLLASYLNIRDLIGFDKVIITLRALDTISAHLG